MATDDNLSRQIAIRLSEEDMATLDRLADAIPIASRNAIARAALRLGLAAIDANPSLLLSAPKKTRKR